MRLNRLPDLTRRELLRRTAQLGIVGAAAPWALNLAAIGEAAAANAPDDYKALVCVFLYGGNDNGSTLLPYDSTGHTILTNLRGGLTTGDGLVEPRDNLTATALTPRIPLAGPEVTVSSQLAMAKELSPLLPLWDAGKLGWLLNVGTLIVPTTKAQFESRSVPLPPKLFSHNDQQSFWQSGGVEGATKGWGGKIGDLFLSNNTPSTFTCINTSGNAVFMSGDQVTQYRIGRTAATPINGVVSNLFGSAQCSEALYRLITAQRTHWMEAELNRVAGRSIEAEALVNSALGNINVSPFLNFDTEDNLGRQLQMVARLIAGRSSLGAQRQVFFVSIGGWDHHDRLLARHPAMLAKLANNLKTFQDAMASLGVENQVTTFTASDFGRTLTSNGDGSDHGWGSDHIIMGGAVQGRRFWGEMPVLANDGPSDAGRGRLIPTTSVDQLGATLARWMGASIPDVSTLFPTISNFNPDLGFFNV